MSGLARKLIRHHVVQRLKEIGPDVGGRILASSTLPLWAHGNSEEFPAVLVYTRREDAEVFNTAPRQYRNTLLLAVEIVALLDENADDVLDDIAEGIEFMFSEDQTLNMLCEYVEMSSTEMTLSQDESGHVFGSAIITFRIIYLTDAVASGDVEPNLLTELQRIYSDWKPARALSDTPSVKDGIEFD